MADLPVRVTPRSSRNGITVETGMVRVWLTASPTDGEANAALIALLAKALDAPKRSVAIIRGATARDKVVRVEGLELGEALRRLAAS
jgi:uncharacterized protein